MVYSAASPWHGFHFYRYKAGVVASQLGLLAATGSVQCQRHRLHWIEEIFGYPMMYGTSNMNMVKVPMSGHWSCSFGSPQ